MKEILLITFALTVALSVNIRTEQQRLVAFKEGGLCPNSSVVGDIFGPNENAGKPPSEQDLGKLLHFLSEIQSFALGTKKVHVALQVMLAPLALLLL